MLLESQNSTAFKWLIYLPHSIGFTIKEGLIVKQESKPAKQEFKPAIQVFKQESKPVIVEPKE